MSRKSVYVFTLFVVLVDCVRTLVSALSPLQLRKPSNIETDLP